MSRAWGYARVCGRRASFASQEFRIREWCARNGFELIGIVEDRASGRIPERPSLCDLYCHLESLPLRDRNVIVTDAGRLADHEFAFECELAPVVLYPRKSTSGWRDHHHPGF